mgnify:CR=1 FL=1
MAMPGWADTWIGGALDAVFAPRCVACRKPTGPHRSGPVCAACWQSVQALSPPWCARCGEPSRTGLTASPGHCARCQAHPPHFDEARALGVYTGALRHIVHALKYRGHQSLGAPLGALLRDRGDDILSAADAVVPVPLHPWRHLQRGFNQADELARTLGPPVWRPLRRRRLGTPQAGLRGQDRLTNVRDAYRLRLAAYGQPPPQVRGTDRRCDDHGRHVRRVQPCTARGRGRLDWGTDSCPDRDAYASANFGRIAASTAARTSSLDASPLMSTQSGRSAWRR